MLAAAGFELTVDLRDFSRDSQASIEPDDGRPLNGRSQKNPNCSTCDLLLLRHLETDESG
jgi:hypothetical protein